MSNIPQGCAFWHNSRLAQFFPSQFWQPFRSRRRLLLLYPPISVSVNVFLQDIGLSKIPMCPKYFCVHQHCPPKYCCAKLLLCTKYCCAQIIVVSKIFQYLCPSTLSFKIFLCTKYFCVQNIVVSKIFLCPLTLSSKILVHKMTLVMTPNDLITTPLHR